MTTDVFDNVVIRASAGSGKTFQLTNRYLRLLLAGVPAETILAATFTRKAAGEILDRALTRLAAAALSDERCRALSRDLFGDGPALPRRALLDLLTTLVRKFQTLNVSTLDSFVMRTAGGFALELGLPPGWHIVEESEDLRHLNTAVRLALSNFKLSDTLTLLNLLFKGETVRSLAAQLYTLSRELLPVYRATGAEQWARLNFRKPLTDAELLERLERLKNAPLPMTAGDPKKKTPARVHALARKALDKMVRTAEAQDWRECCGSGFAKAVLSGSTTYSSKPLDPELIAAVDAVLDQVRTLEINQLAHQTRATRETLRRVIETFETIKNAEGAFRFDDLTFRLANAESREPEQTDFRTDTPVRHLLLDEFQDTSLAQWKILRPIAESLCPTPDDRPRPAAIEVYGPDAPTVLVQPVSHRETSPPERSFFCVGDVKQAIYGWRGGTAELFDEVERKLPVRTESLVRNWRSAPAVIETVNRVFLNLDGSTVFDHSETPKDNSADERRQAAAQRACREWLSRFEKHCAAEPNRSLRGYCTLEVAPLFDAEAAGAAGTEERDDSDDGAGAVDLAAPTDQKGRTIQYAVDRIEQVYRAEPNGTIGVLLRNNKWINRIVAELGRRRIEASQEGGVPLCVSPAVRAFLSLLALADHPGDSVARFHVRQIPALAKRFGVSDDASSAALAAESLQIRREIATDSFASFARRVIAILVPLGDERDVQMLGETLKLAIRYESDGQGRTDRFREIVEGAKTELASASRLRVMTIHKAKGLEFDTVVLPELEDSLLGKPPFYVIERESPTAPILGVYRSINKELQPLLPEHFRACFDRETFINTLESLNLLYVGLTRAVKRLILIVPPEKNKAPGKNTEGKSAARLLRSLLTEQAIAPELPFPIDDRTPEDVLFDGKPSGAQSLFRLGFPPEENAVGAAKPNAAADAAPSDHSLSDDWERPTFRAEAARGPVFERFAPSHKPFRRAWSDPRHFERGTALHRALALVGWLEDGSPSRDAVRNDLITAGFGVEEAERYADAFFAQLRLPGAAALLSRSSYEAAASESGGTARPVLYRERLFLATSGTSASLDRGVVDRLVLLKKDGRTIGADLIDFKTDRIDDPGRYTSNKVTPDDPLVGHYFGQLDAYRRLLTRRFGLDASAVTLRLYLLDIDRTLDFSDCR